MKLIKSKVEYLKPKYLAIGLINIYQKILSLDHGPLKVFFPYGYCCFYPTCSEYSKQAFKKYGLFKGFLKTINRIFRCHPWSQGGYDPLL